MIARYLLVALHALSALTGRRLPLISNNNGGQQYQPPSQPPPPNSSSSDTSTLAIMALIGGIGSWTVLPGIGAYLGLVCGWMELNNIKKGESDPSNKSFAQIGLWLSIVNLVAQALGACIAIVIPLLFGVSLFGLSLLGGGG
jgi:hypothetical protein